MTIAKNNKTLEEARSPAVATEINSRAACQLSYLYLWSCDVDRSQETLRIFQFKYTPNA